MATYAYYVAGAPGKDAKKFDDVRKAAEAFRRSKASFRPYVICVKTQPDGHESACVVGQTSVVRSNGETKYGKWASIDQDFGRAYAEICP